VTVKELLDRVLPGPHYDPEFAKQFKALVKRVGQNRQRMIAARRGDYRAAMKFFDSWMEFVGLFADDPRSLTALTLPTVRIQGAPNCGSLADLFPEGATPTLNLFLYSLEQGADEEAIRYRLASAKPATRAKKAGASKKR
jgi:hypothetical protein